MENQVQQAVNAHERRTIMATTTVCPTRGASLCLAILAGAMAAMACGCRTATYQASALPPELVAPGPARTIATTATPFAAAPLNQDIIYVGDTLRVLVESGDGSDKPAPSDVLVDRNGVGMIPLVGPVGLAGLTLSDASRAIQQASVERDVFRAPAVQVSFGHRRMHGVTVTGAVNRPGEVKLTAGSSNLSAALAAAGGVSPKATSVIEIRRPTHALAQAPGGPIALASYRPGFGAPQQVVHVDIDDMAANPMINPYLDDGTIVHVIEEPPQHITVMGLTGNRTMTLPNNREYRLLDALADAGGLTYSEWISDKVSVIRKVPGTDETVVIRASVRKAKEERAENLMLAAGDVVSVEETPLTFTIGTFGRLLGVGVTAASGVRFVQ
jgi:polysaccharide export outer membrane protein